MKNSLFLTSARKAPRVRFVATLALTATILAGMPIVSGAQEGNTATDTVRETPGRRAPAGREAEMQKARNLDRMSTSSQEREQMREDRVEEREVRREEKMTQMREHARKRINAHVERMVKRFRAALERLSEMADRLASRLNKMEERRIDVSRARALLAEASTAISAAHISVNALPPATEAILQDGGQPKEMLAAIEMIIKPAKESISKAHKALVEALKAAKANVRTGTATTTP